MSVTATGLTNGIKVDQATQKGSVYDVIHLICQKPGNHASQTFLQLEKVYPELTPKWCRVTINNKGRETLVADAVTLGETAWLLPGEKAASFRRKGVESVCYMLGGDLTLADEIQRRHAQVAQQNNRFYWRATQTAAHGCLYQSCPALRSSCSSCKQQGSSYGKQE